MNVSRVQISKETQEALAKPLSRAAKAKLRIDSLKRYIATQEIGHGFTMRDLALAAGYADTEKTLNSGWAWLRYQAKKKKIILEDLGPNQGFAVSFPDYVVVREGRKAKKTETPTETKEDFGDVVFIQQVREKAKDFAWANNSDSLREFIGSLF